MLFISQDLEERAKGTKSLQRLDSDGCNSLTSSTL